MAKRPVGKNGWEERKAKRKPLRVTVRVPMDGDTADRARRLAEQLPEVEAADRRENRLPQAKKLAEEIQRLEQVARDSEEEFVFVPLGRRMYQKILDKHRPTPEQEAAAGARLLYNIETFPKVLLAASCIEPPELHAELTEDGEIADDEASQYAFAEWTELHDERGPGEVALIWQACVDANTEVAATPKSQRASEILATNGSEQS